MLKSSKAFRKAATTLIASVETELADPATAQAPVGLEMATLKRFALHALASLDKIEKTS